MQLTTTGSEMTTEEHVATAETHLQYAEGHLQPSEEHLADAEVHLKLVKAHLVVLEPAEQVEVNLTKMTSPSVPKVPTKETRVVPTAAWKVPKRRAKAASATRKGESTDEAEMVLVSRGRASSSGAKMASPPKEKEKWVCPSDECQESAVHPLDGCKGFRDLSLTKRQKMLGSLWECCLTDCKDKEIGARCYRQTGFRRHRLLRLGRCSRR
jgi:hypothetical protein